jgi:hypothetical protein
VYLLPGLTKPERRSALRRLRLSARMGHCPRLPSGQLALALFADRIKTGIGRAGAVLRLHPAGSTLPVMVLSGGAIAFLLFSGGGTTLSGGTDPTPAPSQGGGSGGGSSSGGSSSSSSPSQPASSSSSSSAPQTAPSATQPASSGLCVKVGPLGVCLKV